MYISVTAISHLRIGQLRREFIAAAGSTNCRPSTVTQTSWNASRYIIRNKKLTRLHFDRSRGSRHVETAVPLAKGSAIRDPGEQEAPARSTEFDRVKIQKSLTIQPRYKNDTRAAGFRSFRFVGCNYINSENTRRPRNASRFTVRASEIPNLFFHRSVAICRYGF